MHGGLRLIQDGLTTLRLPSPSFRLMGLVTFPNVYYFGWRGGEKVALLPIPLIFFAWYKGMERVSPFFLFSFSFHGLTLKIAQFFWGEPLFTVLFVFCLENTPFTVIKE